MEMKELIKLLKAQWPLILSLSILLIPPIWVLVSMYYSGQINNLESQIGLLQEHKNFLEKRIEYLKEQKDDFKKLAVKSQTVKSSALYTPSVLDTNSALHKPFSN